jgi:hypothetical protein
VVQKISRRVVRKLRQLGYLEAGLDDTVATGYDPLRENEPELTRASVNGFSLHANTQCRRGALRIIAAIT